VPRELEREREPRARPPSQGNGRWKSESASRRPKLPLPRNERLERDLFGEAKTGINFENYDSIPVETSGECVPDPIASFKDYDFHEVLKANIELAGYEAPTPVQKHSVPIAGAGRDLMACAQTGSGKTAAFLFPLITKLLRTDLDALAPEDGRPSSFSRRRKAYPFSLILAPTRELATQIYEEARKFTYRTGLRPVVVYGGQEVRTQLKELEMGCDVLVATPGRLVDLIDRGKVSLSRVQYLCFDEADRMLDMGFEPQIRHIVERCDMPVNGRQTLMFSATFPKEIQRLAQDFLNNYVFLAVGRVGSTTDFITQKVEYAQEKDKRDLLMSLLPTCEGLTLIFTETKRGADGLENFLYDQGVNATSIHGDRSQQERETALQNFRCGRCPVLVATDVAARGLDIPNVLHVINYDMPNSIDDYVHRIGRTGRCGNHGTAIAFVNEDNKNILRDLHDLLVENNQKVEHWFYELVHAGSGRPTSYRGPGGGRGGGRGRGRPTRDYRRDQDFSGPSKPSANGGGGGGSGGSRGGGSSGSSGNGGGGPWMNFNSRNRGGNYGTDAW